MNIRNTPIVHIDTDSRPIWRFQEKPLRRFRVRISFFGGGGYQHKRVPRGFSVYFGLRHSDFKAPIGSRGQAGFGFRVTRNGNHGFYVPR